MVLITIRNRKEEELKRKNLLITQNKKVLDTVKSFSEKRRETFLLNRTKSDIKKPVIKTEVSVKEQVKKFAEEAKLKSMEDDKRIKEIVEKK